MPGCVGIGVETPLSTLVEVVVEGTVEEGVGVGVRVTIGLGVEVGASVELGMGLELELGAGAGSPRASTQ
jgi:hypothetical protein